MLAMNFYKKVFLFSLLTVLIVIFAFQLTKPSKDKLLATLISSDNFDEIKICSWHIKSLGIDGIKLFVIGINEINKNPKNLNNTLKLSVIESNLHDMALQELYTLDEVAALTDSINLQISLSGTLRTAKLLTLITKVDVEYNEEFVNKYTEKDEEIRQKMILKWRKWHENQLNE